MKKILVTIVVLGLAAVLLFAPLPFDDTTRITNSITVNRTLEYRSPNLLFVVLNRVSIRDKVQEESAEAMRRLHDVLDPRSY